MFVFPFDRYDLSFIRNLAEPAQRLGKLLSENKGARIGQATVISTKMHIYQPATPQEIQILQHTDAGQVFYHRAEPGQVFHLDVFHQCGLLDHQQVASAMKAAVETYNFHCSLENLILDASENEQVSADLIDIQTATGGGRVTGNLTYGKKASLRRAHENHVHVAAMLPPYHLFFLFYIVVAVEGVIGQSQLELRRNERITHCSTAGGSHMDLTAYADQTDSFLRAKRPEAMSPTVKKHQCMQDIADLMETFDSTEHLQDLFSLMHEGAKSTTVRRWLESRGDGQQVLERLNFMGIAEKKGKKTALTEYGKSLEQFLMQHQPDVKAHLRQTLRMVKPCSNQLGRCKLPNRAAPYADGAAAASTVPVPIQEGAGGELAVAETIYHAARRAITEKQTRISVSGDDLQHIVKHKQRKAEICLVIDASASMAGQRLRAAKFLVQHLLLSTPDKIGVIVFQENRAPVQVPLTRDYNKVEQSLGDIIAYGSTPLALGLKSCLQHLQEVKVHNPLIILITDGVPTMADTSRDPMTDALEAAHSIKEKGYQFTCIGLKPHHDYLEELARVAGGKACIVEELEKRVLVKAAWSKY